MTIAIHHGDCLAVLPTLVAESIDAVVTDPPYHLSAMSKRFGKVGSAPALNPAFSRHNAGFMGQQWDGGDIAFRPETWEAVARVMKPGAALLAFGGSRTWHRLASSIEIAGFEIRDTLAWLYGSGFPKSKSLLKPAYEPIVLAVKPGPLRELNLDACRIGTDGGTQGATAGPSLGIFGDGLNGKRGEPVPDLGRWPANVILDETAAAMLDEQSGKRGAAAAASGPTFSGPSKSGSMAGHFNGMGDRDPQFYADSGGASRFFFTAKTPRSQRDDGLGARNTHPTVKPLDLMAWLIRLVTPPGGIVLDPFLGSGTTAVACVGNGFSCIGIEREAQYVDICEQRIGLGCEVHR